MVENIEFISTEQVFSMFTPRAVTAAKWDVGRVLIVCGSYGMAGAAVISARACIECGAGLCEVVCPDSVYPIIAAQLPEAVFLPYRGQEDDPALRRAIARADCVAFGCGCGQSDYTVKMLHTLLECCKTRLIIDADGLNVLATLSEPATLERTAAELIITPHAVEMARLCGTTPEYVLQNRVSVAQQCAQRLGAVTVLKGHDTLVLPPQGNVARMNRCGNPGMACAGSGDMLCGMIAAFAAAGLSGFDAATAGVHLHALAGDLCAARYSQRGTTPGRMLSCLPELLLQLEAQIN